MSDHHPDHDLFQQAGEQGEKTKEKEAEPTLTFEEAMDKLEEIVDQLEAGEVPLEQAIELFQEGMRLSKTCHQKLEQIEKKVHVLIEENDELVKKEFSIEEDPS